ncbi:MAG TPA: hypothetical protein VIN39_10190 [Candidatus Dormibacteraeota bacterium]
MRKGIAIGGMIGTFFLGVLIGAAGASGSHPTTAATSAQELSAPSAASTPAAPKAWVQVAHFTGSGQQKTTPFTVGSQWRLHLVNHGDSNFIIDAKNPSDPGGHDIPLVNVIGNFDQVTQEYDAGTWYLDIEGNTWDLTVEDYH